MIKKNSFFILAGPFFVCVEGSGFILLKVYKLNMIGYKIKHDAECQHKKDVWKKFDFPLWKIIKHSFTIKIVDSAVDN